MTLGMVDVLLRLRRHWVVMMDVVSQQFEQLFASDWFRPDWKQPLRKEDRADGILGSGFGFKGDCAKVIIGAV